MATLLASAILSSGLVVEVYEGGELWLIETTGKKQEIKLVQSEPINLLLFLAKNQDLLRSGDQDETVKPEQVLLNLTGLEALLCQFALEVYVNLPVEQRSLRGYTMQNEYALAIQKRLITKLGEHVNGLARTEEALTSFARMLRKPHPSDEA